MRSIETTITTADGFTYSATLYTSTQVVAIAHQERGEWIWAGEGKWDGESIADCPADLGDEVYRLLDAALTAAIAGKGPKYSSEDIALEGLLSLAANEEGTIDPGAMLSFTTDPKLHTTMSVARAFTALTGKEYDTDFFFA